MEMIKSNVLAEKNEGEKTTWETEVQLKFICSLLNDAFSVTKTI
jgi:hypothetical protein